MEFDDPSTFVIGDVLARNWGLLALRGAVSLLFGLFALFQPAIALSALVLVFGAYALVDGAFAVLWAIKNRRGEPHWVALLLGGLAGIVAGVFTFVMPMATALALLYLIAAWSVVVGVSEIAASIRLRKRMRREWLLALAGVLSVALGTLLAMFPQAGSLVLVLWIGGYAAATGVLLIVLAFRLRGWSRAHPPMVPRVA
jgi:uncharacterized membrane protein HdeD (DUF308 family)